MKNKLILSGLILTGVVSCASFKPLVLTEAYLNPATTTAVTYDDINFQNALFNQFASQLSFTLRVNYSSAAAGALFRSLGVFISYFGYFNNWTTITSTFSEGECAGACKAGLTKSLFNREFDTTTGKATSSTGVIILTKFGNDTGPNDTVNLEIKVKSLITYNVNVGAVYLASKTFVNGNINNFYTWITFYKDGETLNTFLLNQNTSNVQIDILYDLANVLTGIDAFDLWIQWVDSPPFATAASQTELIEFNLFTQGSEIRIPDDASGEVFGFKFVAVEWWDILGHLQNFAWWIVNKSPISPLFIWIDTYIISWISGLITFITGVFDL